MKPMTELPGIVLTWLATLGITGDKFLAEWNRLAEEATLPETWRASLVDWVTVNVTANLADTVKQKISEAIVELLSGAPGYNPEHGSLA